ncbi:MAG TPA: hypothetical protein VEN79_08750 [Terriglobia bacterium]|nr:hypothetical protein [Terriglobia bacterium]
MLTAIDGQLGMKYRVVFMDDPPWVNQSSGRVPPELGNFAE